MNYFDQIITGKFTAESILENRVRNRKGGRGRPVGIKSETQETLLKQAGLRLQMSRKAAGYSIDDIANILGVTGNCYRIYEKRFGLLAQTKHLSTIVSVLNVSTAWISGQTDEMPIFQEAASFTGNVPTTSNVKLSEEYRRKLVKRARNRRKELKLSRADMAMMIEVPEIDSKRISALESYLPVTPNLVIENKWEQILQVPAGWIRDMDIRETPINQLKAKSMQRLVIVDAKNISDEIKGISRWLSRAHRFTRTVLVENLNEFELRSATIFAQRYCVNGQEDSTLQVIADKYVLTRQRIEQITKTMSHRSEFLIVETPFLDQLEQEIKPLLPQSIIELDKHFRKLLGESLSIVGVERFAKDILKRSIVTITETPTDLSIPWDAVAIDPKTHNGLLLRTIRDVSMAMIRSVGAAQIEFIAGNVSKIISKGVTPLEISDIAKLIPGFVWLREKEGWFWLGEKYENRLLNVVKKVLAVANRRVDIEDIHGAMARSRRIKYEATNISTFSVEAPYIVLVSVLALIPWVELVQFDDFRLRKPINLKDVLSTVELSVYRYLIAKGGIAARYEIQKALVDVIDPIFTQIALHSALDASPIFYRMDSGIFALRGIALSPNSFGLAHAAVGGILHNNKHLAAPIPDDSGELTIQIEILPYMINSSYFEIPMRLARMMEEGVYTFIGFKESLIYKILPSGANRLHRFTKQLKQEGYKIGDNLLLQVNPINKTIQIKKYI
jgi:transcriptional regulator with XRE-family HTH domain